MKILIPSTRFKKDLKRYANSKDKLEALRSILEMLKNETPIPAKYSPHKLVGNYKGFMECHIQSDFLLIWIEDDVIELVRLGSHSELYNKQRR